MISNRTLPNALLMTELVYDDVGEACDWLCRVFGFAERWRVGNHRAQLAVGDCAVALMESRVGGVGEPSEGTAFAPEPEGRLSHAVMVRVPDADGHHARALAEGARILQAPRDFAYGERQYTAVDVGGHRWTFSQSIADVAPEEWGGRSGSALS